MNMKATLNTSVSRQSNCVKLLFSWSCLPQFFPLSLSIRICFLNFSFCLFVAYRFLSDSCSFLRQLCYFKHSSFSHHRSFCCTVVPLEPLCCHILQEAIDCNIAECSSDCVWGNWSEWSTCSASCGGGHLSATCTLLP